MEVYRVSVSYTTRRPPEVEGGEEVVESETKNFAVPVEGWFDTIEQALRAELGDTPPESVEMYVSKVGELVDGGGPT